MKSMSLAETTVLLGLHSLGMILLFFHHVVISLLALGACQGNFYAHLATSAYFFLISIRDFYTQKKDLNLCRVM